MLKDALISECTTLATGQDVFIHWGFWGSDTHEQLTASQASQFCHKAWDHDSFSEIFWLLCEIIFMPLFTFLAFSYARQESALGAARNDLPRTYAPAYATGPAYAAGNESTITLPEVAYDQQYPPPPGSPPPFDKSLPAYGLPAYGEEADKKDTDSMRTAVAEDPFADIEGYPRR
ncbi:hypothetical protein F5148DRAFT_1283331 [Russula earlei]|uniref:Uncharacterized protein n=1 Tax=Russula earlei TaxID=71964 RepID=A0ACC0UDC3_9AGAM|nr:hypothetical protein F5148DRAFT_1283331 [Russula earlei]